MPDDIEQAYHIAMGNCLEAMQALRRLSGNEAIAEMEAAIRSIRSGQRQAEARLRRERALNRLAQREL